MDSQEQQYIRGFNHGYLLTKYLPDLVVQLIKHIKETTNEYISGFFSGKEEWELEYEREQLGELENLRNRPRDHERDI
jgi:hypothetical protein